MLIKNACCPQITQIHADKMLVPSVHPEHPELKTMLPGYSADIGLIAGQVFRVVQNY
jgi:hypothetical protein